MGGRWLQGHNELGLHKASDLFLYCHLLGNVYRHKLARLKEDGSRHPNLNLFLINRHSAGSAL